MATIRLQKALAHAGVASRRAAERLIAEGRVRIDGRVVTELGTKVDPRASRIEVDGERVVRESPVYALLHKPRGVVSTMHDPEGRPTVRDLLKDVPGRVYPVGRLDFNTSGALLVTNDGDFADALLHPRRGVPKTYVVKVQGAMQPRDVDRWRGGVDLEDGKTLPAKVKLLRYEGDKTWLELTISEGRNLQVRRMGDATGFRVMRLSRVSFAGVASEGLAPGRWRYLTTDEQRALKKEFGVPRRVVSQAAPTFVERTRQSRARTVADARHVERHGGPSAKRAAADERHGGGPGKRIPADARHVERHGGPSAKRAAADERYGERYGGGAPGRRPAGPSASWGGGARRGSSGGRDAENVVESSPPGRGGRTRTTGTGGGIGAEPGDYRIGGRRRS